MVYIDRSGEIDEPPSPTVKSLERTVVMNSEIATEIGLRHIAAPKR